MLVLVAAALLASAAAGVWFALHGSTAGPRAAGGPRSARVPGWIEPFTVVAALRGPAFSYAYPDAPTPAAILPATWAGATAPLPVLASQPGWIEVAVLAPPARTTPIVWVRAADAALTRTPYHLVVDASRTRLLLFRDAALVRCAPAGIGAIASPTPLGHYFVTLLARPPRPAYGSFVIVTSARSDATTDWHEAGLSTITIEGPLDSEAAIGATGARITTGSVRLLESDLERLRGVPLGSPIDVVPAMPRATSSRLGAGCPAG
jgi:hypothetical protein